MSPTIRFTPTMYAAALSGRKTQTRRVLCADTEDTPQPGPADSCYWYHPAIERHGLLDAGPQVYGVSGEETGWIATYGPPGTTLPIVTTWAISQEWDALRPSIMDPEVITAEHPIWFDDNTPKPAWAGKSRPAMFFPKQLYPLVRQATVVEVRAQRLQWICEADAWAEGIGRLGHPLESLVNLTMAMPRVGDVLGALALDFPNMFTIGGNESPRSDRERIVNATARGVFAALWNSINLTRAGGAYSWKANPWVFATTFKVLPAQEPTEPALHS